MANRFETVQQWVQALPNLVDPSRVGDLDTAIQLDLEGDGGGNWNLIVKDGALAVNEGRHADPELTLTTAAADWMAVINGESNPMGLFMQGKIKIQGDMQLAMKLQSLLSG